MAVSKKYVASFVNRTAVVQAFIGADKPTTMEVARRLNTTPQNVRACLKMELSSERLKAESSLRYSRSKMDTQNPMKGKFGSLHHNYKGVCENSDGYLTIKLEGRYVLLHRLIVAQALGLTKLPSGMDVHHINGDKRDNDLDNLAIVTKSGHAKIHSENHGLQKSPLWDQWVSGISELQETKAI